MVPHCTQTGWRKRSDKGSGSKDGRMGKHYYIAEPDLDPDAEHVVDGGASAVETHLLPGDPFVGWAYYVLNSEGR